jgi:hypothetical protein
MKFIFYLNFAQKYWKRYFAVVHQSYRIKFDRNKKNLEKMSLSVYSSKVHTLFEKVNIFNFRKILKLSSFQFTNKHECQKSNKAKNVKFQQLFY